MRQMTITKTVLDVFRNVLRTKEAEWANAIRNREAIVIETDSDVIDQVQRAAERELELSRLDRESSLLRDVRAALQRIDAEMFGFCLNCKDEMSRKRLAAVPWTPLCINCQEAADNEGEHLSNSIMFNIP